jgi:Holliday junction resolvase RusA-like endonuclease
MLDESVFPTKKPDIDNVVKSIFDALNKVAFNDDTQIISLSVRKFYSEHPRVEVTIWEYEE